MRDRDREALQNFDGARETLGRIRKELRSSAGQPGAGSALAVDDQLWPHHPTSQVVWAAMVSASDHLDLVMTIADAIEEQTYITAWFSVARGALVAASQALWIVGSEDPNIRQQRALSIGVEHLAQRIGYQREQLKVCSPEQQELSQAQLDEVLLPMLEEAKQKVKKGYRYTDTKVIEQAVRYRFSEDTENAVVTADLIWRRLGGDAHALGWQLLLGDLEWEGDNDPEQLGPVYIGADIESFLQAAMWAATFLRVAMDRFQELSEALP